ncbi:MAG: Rho termination factor N-terminal domain-containing protein [Promethearchaeota archaeon]
MTRKIDDNTYLSYLLQSLNVKELKQICKDFQLVGYSKFKKAEIIEFILDSLSEEEMKELLKEKEIEIVSKEIDLAIKKINGQDRESIDSIRIVNPDNHEIETKFKGFNWEITSFLSITKNNIDNPERDCDCRIGSNMGFCNHFWVGFIFSLKEGYFTLKDWNLTALPKDFEERIDSIVLRGQLPSEEEGEKTDAMRLVDKSSEDFQFMELVNNSITVYEGEIANLEKKEQDFQGNITIYYLTSLKNVKIGPRIQKQSEYKEEDIKSVESLNLRLSEKLHNENNLKLGEKISANGKLTRDNFLRMYIVKNIRKIEKLK